MMKVSVKLRMPDDLVLADGQKAGQAMAEAVRDLIRRHLTDRSMSTADNPHGLPHSGYWHKAANTTKVEAQDGLRAVVSVGAESDAPDAPGQGVALHYFGGTVYPKKKALAIPINPQVAGKNPREANALTDHIALVWPKNSSHGFLKDAETGDLLWLLVPKATIRADKTVLPTDEELQDAAIDAVWGAIAS